jgi:hypothetical protein
VTGRLLALFLAGCGAWAAIEAGRRMPLGTLADPGPGLLPLVLAGLLAVLAGAAALARGPSPPAPAATGRALVVAALLVVYPLLLPRLGFGLTTALAMFALARAIEPRPVAALALFAGLGTAGALLLFRHVLAVPLPRGPWGF